MVVNNLQKSIKILAIWLLLATGSHHIVAQEVDGYPVSYEGEALFSLYRNVPRSTASERAEEATKLLAHAIESKDIDPSTPLVEVDLKNNRFLLYVRGELVATVFEEDAKFSSEQSLKGFADLIHVKVKTLVERELTRQKWQSIALRFFISMILLVLGAFLLRQLKVAFDRLEILMLEKQNLLQKLRIFGSPLFAGHSATGLLAFLIEVLRWLVYLTTIAILLISMLSQFDLTRGVLRAVGRSTVQDFVATLQRTTMALPGLLLGGFILLSLHIGIHAFNLILEGVRTKRVMWRKISVHRVPIFRVAIPFVLLSIFLPLVIASIFRRFDTPMQWLVIGVSLICILGAVPIIGAWLCGALVIWRNELRDGDWISIMGHKGEIASINTFFVNLVPLRGGMISIPTFMAMFSPVEKSANIPSESINVRVAKEENLKELVASLEQALAGVAQSVFIRPTSITDKDVILQISFLASSKDTSSQVVYRILDFESSGQLKLDIKA